MEKVFDLVKENEPIEGCTLSSVILKGVSVFSLGKDTDISAESNPYEKLITVLSGQIRIFSGKDEWMIMPGESFAMKKEIAYGIQAMTESVYVETSGKDMVNETVKAGEVFDLNEKVPYREGKIVNMDIMHTDHMKYAVMAFDAGTGLDEHAAPGDAIVNALDGEGIIGYEGKEYVLKKGQSFRFARGGRHYVRAEKRFRMSLTLTLE